ncbi:MAG TPA: MBL fold metallo-hydrolase [Chthoniobacterales bacterium]
MKHSLLILILSAQSVFAGLQNYSALVAADPPFVRTTLNSVRVTYLGTNGYQFEFGRHVLLVDPYFTRINLSSVLLDSRIQPDEQRIDSATKHLAPKIDAILVTHGHFDHLLDVPTLMRRRHTQLLGSDTAVKLARYSGVPKEASLKVAPGDTRVIGPWKIRCLAATHDTVFPIGVPFSGPLRSSAPKKASDWVCGEPLAYIVEIAGQRIYVDSGGTSALLPPKNLPPVDLAILGVALPDSRARFAGAVRRLRPRYIVPSHQDDFFRSLDAGFQFGLLSDFPRVLRDYQSQRLPGHLILLDYFKPWTLPHD